MSTVATGRQCLLLEELMHQRRWTREKTIEALERRARDLGVRDFSLSVRQLDRWLAGQLETRPRLAVCHVVEEEFGRPIEDLLSPYVPAAPAGTHRQISGTGRLRTEEFVSWLADHSDVDFTDLWNAVSDAAQQMEATAHHQRATVERARAAVGRCQIGDAVASYYGEPDYLYQADVGGRHLRLSVLARPSHRGLALPITDASGSEVVTDTEIVAPLLPQGVRAAVARLGAVEVDERVMVNDLLYRLTHMQITDTGIHPTFALMDFASYALTGDLLEEELVDHLAARSDGSMPLRELYLPSVDRAWDFCSRYCAGGPACLTAIARPDGDYALLVQQRSSRVLNVAGRLAVIPKAFHQPMVDSIAESAIGSTVERELEEELFGRADLDQLAAAAGRRAAPRHPLNLSAPGAWLLQNPDRWKLECTAFGVNLVNGNYEFACLLVIEDPSWWELHGHQVEANWETMRLRCWSTLDTDGLAKLAFEPNWSNEGLFAFIEGLRRLAVIGGDRVRLPSIEPTR
jgi:hypothetical protein